MDAGPVEAVTRAGLSTLSGFVRNFSRQWTEQKYQVFPP
jgi:hypothetical protein